MRKWTSFLLILVLLTAGCAKSQQLPAIPTPVIGVGLDLLGIVTTIAGSGFSGSTDGTGRVASFNDPVGIATDGTILYVADTYNHKIRTVVISSGLVSTLAGSGVEGYGDATGVLASFDSPSGIATDGTLLYVADTGNNMIREVTIASGVVTTLAGSGVPGTDDGIGTSASFNRPTGITTDGTCLYVSDTYNNKIRQIVIASGLVTTLAGNGDSGSIDGGATDASFDTPSGITNDGSRLYVADAQNNLIREVEISSGKVSTLAGSGASGSTDGIGTGASFWYPEGITTDGTFVYVADTQNDTIRAIAIVTGTVVTLAGAGTPGFVAGTGAAAYLDEPIGLTTDGVSLYFADTGNRVIRRVH